MGRKRSSGKNGCSYFLKYTPREILSPFFKKFEKKKRKTRMLRWWHLLTIVTERPRILLMKCAGGVFSWNWGLVERKNGSLTVVDIP